MPAREGRGRGTQKELRFAVAVHCPQKATRSETRRALTCSARYTRSSRIAGSGAQEPEASVQGFDMTAPGFPMRGSTSVRLSPRGAYRGQGRREHCGSPAGEVDALRTVALPCQEWWNGSQPHVSGCNAEITAGTRACIQSEIFDYHTSVKCQCEVPLAPTTGTFSTGTVPVLSASVQVPLYIVPL